MSERFTIFGKHQEFTEKTSQYHYGTVNSNESKAILN